MTAAKPGLVIAFVGSTLTCVGFLSALSAGMVTGNWWPALVLVAVCAALVVGGWLQREWKKEHLDCLREDLDNESRENKRLTGLLRHERQKAKDLSAQLLALTAIPADGEPLTSWESIAFLELQQNLGGAS